MRGNFGESLLSPAVPFRWGKGGGRKPVDPLPIFFESSVLSEKGRFWVRTEIYSYVVRDFPRTHNRGVPKLESEGGSGGIPDRARSTRRAVENSERSSTSPTPDSGTAFGIKTVLWQCP